MGGSKEYGLLTKSQIDGWEHASKAYRETSRLTPNAIYTAMKRVIDENPDYLNATSQQMAKAVVRDLKDNGFKGVSAKNGMVIGTNDNVATKDSDEQKKVTYRLKHQGTVWGVSEKR